MQDWNDECLDDFGKKRENEWNISVEVPRLWQWSQKNSKDRDDMVFQDRRITTQLGHMQFYRLKEFRILTWPTLTN